MAIAKLSRLNAVNRMLLAASEQPVSSLVDDGVNDTNAAETILDEATLAIQLESPNCSTTIETRNPTEDGYILLPDTVVSADTVDEDFGNDVTIRGRSGNVRLFSITNNSYVFDDPVKLRLVTALDFEELPVDLQFWVVDHATRRYQMIVQGDQAIDVVLAEAERVSRIRSRAEDIRQRDRSILNTPGAYAATRRGWGVWRTRVDTRL
jgi:hypothetical protein